MKAWSTHYSAISLWRLPLPPNPHGAANSTQCLATSLANENHPWFDTYSLDGLSTQQDLHRAIRSRCEQPLKSTQSSIGHMLSRYRKQIHPIGPIST